MTPPALQVKHPRLSKPPSFAPTTCAALVAALVLLPSCKSGPETAGEARANVPPPTFAVDSLLGPCWPDDASPDERVKLTLIRDDRTVRDVMFETENGASNTTGRCLRQIMWEYPWRGDVPDTVELLPPKQPSHGWATLEHIRLLSNAAGFQANRGILDPIPLVHACLRNGTGIRPGVVFFVQTQPIRVFVFIAGPGNSYAASFPSNDSERCVQAVLASTVYPGPRTYRLDFNRGTAPGEPAPRAEVAQYFEPQDVKEATGTLDQMEAKAALSGLQPEVSQCWEAALNRRGGLAGARALRIRVTSSGAVAFAQVIPDMGLLSGNTDSEAVDYLLDRCLVSAVTHTKIPPPEGGPADLAYSWNFALRH